MINITRYAPRQLTAVNPTHCNRSGLDRRAVTAVSPALRGRHGPHAAARLPRRMGLDCLHGSSLVPCHPRCPVPPLCAGLCLVACVGIAAHALSRAFGTQTHTHSLSHTHSHTLTHTHSHTHTQAASTASRAATTSTTQPLSARTSPQRARRPRAVRAPASVPTSTCPTVFGPTMMARAPPGG